MDENRSLRKKEDSEELVIYDGNNTLYTTCSDIQVVLDDDIQRRVTVVTGGRKPPRRSGSVQIRSQSADLRRQAILNNALQSEHRSRSRSQVRTPVITELSESSSGSRTSTQLSESEKTGTNSRSRSVSRSNSRTSPTRSRSLSRARKPLYYRPKSRSIPRSRSRSRSRSLGRQVALRRGRSRIRRKNETTPISSRSIRLPSKTPIEELLTTPSKSKIKLPDSIQLPSPLFILTEQQVTGVSKTLSVEFVTKILLTTKKLTMKERQGLYAEMVEAENIGGSRSSTDLQENDSAEDFSCKIYYSDKGIYIQTTQVVKKIPSSKHLKIGEEKTYSNICKTRIIGGMGKFIDGYLNIKCEEKIQAKNQLYTRSEVFTIGLQTEKANGTYDLNSEKKTFDPTKSIKFSEKILFDRTNIGIVVNHSASADMSKYWNHEAGSFGEQNCEYREINFFFAAPTVAEVQQKNTTPTRLDSSMVTRNAHRKNLAKNMERITNAANRSITNTSQSNQANTSVGDQSHLLITPVATSTPRSEPSSSAPSTEATTSSVSTPKRKRGAMSIRESARVRFPDANSTAGISIAGPRDTTAEVDIDKSLKENNSSKVKTKKKKTADATNNNSQYLYTTAQTSSYFPTVNNTPVSNLNKSTNTSRDETKKSPISSKISSKKTTSSQKLALTPVKNIEISNENNSNSNKGQLRIKETKITREVHESHGKPPTVNEKKEETIKVQDVSFDCSKKPKSPSPYKVKTSEKSPSEIKIAKVVQSMDVTIENEGKKLERQTSNRSVVVDSKTPIKIDNEADDKLKLFHEYLTLEALVDGKPLDINLNLDLLAKQKPKMEIKRVKFSGKLLWEKSSEWNLSTADQTSNTKTIATQQSDILGKTPK